MYLSTEKAPLKPNIELVPTWSIGMQVICSSGWNRKFQVRYSDRQSVASSESWAKAVGQSAVGMNFCTRNLAGGQGTAR